MRFRLLTTVLLFLVLFCFFINSSEAQVMEYITPIDTLINTWTNISDYDFIDNYTILTTGTNGLLIYNSTDPSNPEFVTSIEIYAANKTMIFGNYALVKTHFYDDKIVIVNLTDPQSPSICHTIAGSDYQIYDAEICGNHLVLHIGNSEYDARFVVYDITEPNNPVQINDINLETNFYEFHAIGEYITLQTRGHFSSEYTFKIYSISESGSFNEVSQYTFSDPGVDFDYTTIFHTGDNVIIYHRYNPFKIFILDISNIESPVLEAEYTDSEFIGAYHYSNNYLYFVADDMVHVYDTIYPTESGLIDSFSLNNFDQEFLDFGTIAINNGRMYVSTYDDYEYWLWSERRMYCNGFMVLDISSPSNVTQLGFTGGGDLIFDMKRYNDRIVTRGIKTRFFDISNPEAISEIGVIDNNFDYISISEDHFVGGKYNIRDHSLDRILTYDISEINSPQLINTFYLDYEYAGIVSSDNYIVVNQYSNDENFLKLYEMPTDASQPMLLDEVTDSGGGDFYPYTMMLKENFLYVVGYYEDNQVQIYEIVENEELVLRNELHVCDEEDRIHLATDIELEDNYLFVYGGSGMKLYDISDPINPEYMYVFYSTESCSHDFSYQNDHLCGAGYYGFEVNVLNNNNIPQRTGRYYRYGYYMDIYVSGYYHCRKDNYVFLGDVNKIRIFDISSALDVEDEIEAVTPESYELLQAYPNPFNPTLNIKVSLPETGVLKMTVHNVLGREVAVLSDQTLNRGYHNFAFDGSELSSGVYFVRAVVEGKMNDVQKVILMK